MLITTLLIIERDDAFIISLTALAQCSTRNARSGAPPRNWRRFIISAGHEYIITDIALLTRHYFTKTYLFYHEAAGHIAAAANETFMRYH